MIPKASDMLRTVSLVKMHNSLSELFVDRTKVDLGMNIDDDVEDMMRYNRCKHLNDERVISFNQRFKQEHDVFNEDLGIWIDGNIDVEKDNCFIPRDDAI